MAQKTLSKTKFVLKVSVGLALLSTVVNLAMYLYKVVNTNFVDTPVKFLNTETDEIDHPGRLLDMHDFEYIIPQPCYNSKLGKDFKPDAVVLIHSAPMKYEERKALRETWLHSNSRILAYFMLGKTARTVQKRIFEENEKFNDIIQGNFIDSYHNLTYKHTMVMKWFDTHCTGVKHLIKMDDDVFMNVPEVLKYLENNEEDLSGVWFPPEEPQRSGKWKITQEVWKESVYPSYCFGPSVIYSSQYVHAAYLRTLTSRFYWVDDVFMTGFIRVQLLTKIKPINDRILIGRKFAIFLYNNDTKYSNFLFTRNALPLDLQYKFMKRIDSFKENVDIQNSTSYYD